MSRLVRNPDLLICWRRGQLFFRELSGGKSLLAAPETVLVLDLFSRPLTADAAADALSGYERATVLRSIRQLTSAGLLVPEGQARRRESRLRVWKNNVASAYYHSASRDGRYLNSAAAIDIFLRSKVMSTPRPARLKRYPRAMPFVLRATPLRQELLEETLLSRRTIREFSRQPVSSGDLAEILRLTWGQTGWIDGGPLGKLVGKTSPSAGSLHPIECYVLAWNVKGLAKGLYHYDVKGDELRRLKRGDFRREAVKAASGQRWVGSAAFLCIMTAVFERTLWKYQFEAAYRVLWMDAGHLAQTFALLATARGLGPFQTAAIQDSFIEALIGLDGVKEFPVYLVGAGVPLKSSRPGKPRARSKSRRGPASTRS